MAFRNRARVPVEKHGRCINGAAGFHSERDHAMCPVEWTTSTGKQAGIVFSCQCKEHGGHGDDVLPWPLQNVDQTAVVDEDD
jgi:hypothetical protein